MPDVKLLIARDLFSTEQLAELLAALRSSVATNLSGVNYEGKTVTLSPSDVDIYTVFFDHSASATGHVMTAEIVGYDWPDRMEVIPVRLTNIKRVIDEHLRLSSRSLIVNTCPIRFTPVGRRHWHY
jgi:hypothetical protein